MGAGHIGIAKAGMELNFLRAGAEVLGDRIPIPEVSCRYGASNCGRACEVCGGTNVSYLKCGED